MVIAIICTSIYREWADTYKIETLIACENAETNPKKPVIVAIFAANKQANWQSRSLQAMQQQFKIINLESQLSNQEKHSL